MALLAVLAVFSEKNKILHRSEATRPSGRIGIFQTVSQTVSQDSQRSRRQRHPKLRAPDHQKTPTDHHKMQSRWNHSQILSGFWLRWMRKVRRRARAARSHKLLKLRRARGFSFFRLWCFSTVFTGKAGYWDVAYAGTQFGTQFEKCTDRKMGDFCQSGALLPLEPKIPRFFTKCQKWRDGEKMRKTRQSQRQKHFVLLGKTTVSQNSQREL